MSCSSLTIGSHDGCFIMGVTPFCMYSRTRIQVVMAGVYWMRGTVVMYRGRLKVGMWWLSGLLVNERTTMESYDGEQQKCTLCSKRTYA